MNHVKSKLKNPYLNSVFATDHNLKTIFHISHNICQTQIRILFSFCTWWNGTKWHSNSNINIISLQTQIEFSWFEKNVYMYSSWSTYTTQTKVTTQSKMLHVLDNFQGIPTNKCLLNYSTSPPCRPKKELPPREIIAWLSPRFAPRQARPFPPSTWFQGSEWESTGQSTSRGMKVDDETPIPKPPNKCMFLFILLIFVELEGSTKGFKLWIVPPINICL